ncbi:MAG: Na+/H+ antiporter NhaA [Planctomycetota bacterium]|nr:Na+/H+ antiporter NhaA [Planctomycetota bacterium]
MASSSIVNRLREFSVPLLVGVAGALLWANLSPSSYHAFVHHAIVGPVNVEFLVNELFMVLFFGIAAVEITDNLVPGGSLNPVRKAITPLFATLGGVVGPAATYLLLNMFFGDASLTRGWGIGTATDIALAWLVARLVFGEGHPAIAFLLLLAVADDAIGLAIIAVFYPDPAHPVFLPALGLVAAGMLVAFALRRLAVRSYWPYLLLGGTVSWAGLFLAHLHPALALVFIVPFMPHHRPAAAPTAKSTADEGHFTLASFEHAWKIVVDFGLLFFGLANAGVQFSAAGTVTWLVLASLVVGKTLGIFGFGLLASWMGFALPAGMTRRDLFLAGVIAAIGLTVALFVAGAAFMETALQGAAKMGALGSALAAPLAFIVARVWKNVEPRGEQSKIS